MPGKNLSAEELHTLETVARERGWRAAVAALPHRAPSGLRRRLEEMGLYKQSRRHWKIADRALLKQMWNARYKEREIADALGRTREAVRMYVEIHRKDLGLIMHCEKMTPGQRNIIGSDVERLLEQLRTRTGRRRGPLIQAVIRYLMGESRRKHLVSITDLGGMTRQRVAS